MSMSHQCWSTISNSLSLPRTRQPWRSPSPLKASSRMRSETTPFRWTAAPRSRYTGPLLSDAPVDSVRGRRGPQRRRGARQCSTHTPFGEGRAWTCPGNRRRPPRKVKQPRATTATRIPGIDRRSGWPEGESPTGRPRVRSGRDFRPYVRSRREGKLGVHRDSHVQRVLVHAPAVALAARCRTGMGNGTGAS